MGPGSRHCSSVINHGSGGDEFFPTLQGSVAHDLLPIPPADGMGRTPTSGDHLSEGGDNCEV